jgi:hypothetical protein
MPTGFVVVSWSFSGKAGDRADRPSRTGLNWHRRIRPVRGVLRLFLEIEPSKSIRRGAHSGHHCRQFEFSISKINRINDMEILFRKIKAVTDELNVTEDPRGGPSCPVHVSAEEEVSVPIG